MQSLCAEYLGSMNILFISNAFGAFAQASEIFNGRLLNYAKRPLRDPMIVGWVYGCVRVFVVLYGRLF